MLLLQQLDRSVCEPGCALLSLEDKTTGTGRGDQLALKPAADFGFAKPSLCGGPLCSSVIIGGQRMIDVLDFVWDG